MLELSSYERNCIKTPTNVYATLYNVCNLRAVTIQTNSTLYLKVLFRRLVGTAV